MFTIHVSQFQPGVCSGRTVMRASNYMKPSVLSLRKNDPRPY